MKILNVSSLGELRSRSAEIKRHVASEGAILIRGIFDQLKIRQSLKLVYAKLDNECSILGTTQGSRKTVRENSLKWSVGASSGAQVGNARFMITAYNPISAEDIYGFRAHFTQLIAARDAIRDDNNNTFDESLSGESFNACRFQIYPNGGGFMLGHRDYIAETASKEQNVQLLQLVLFVTQRGIDFERGGGYLVHDHNHIDIEELAQSGDIAIYDGQSFHGVADIDPIKPVDTSKIRGRVVALVTIYQ